jgi:chromosome segregation ATPase
VVHHTDQHDQQLAEARAAFRRERDADRRQIAADREEADRLKREARALHKEAARTRDRTRGLAARYARQARQKLAGVRADVEARQAAVDEARGQLSAEVARFEIARSEFHATAAEEKDRLREAWAALDAQRRRAAAEHAEANDFAARQEAALAARAADLAAREQALGGTRAKLDKECAGLRTEVAGLEARAENARAAVEELERRRDQVRADLLGPVVAPDQEPPGELVVALDRAADRDLTRFAAELDARDQQLVEEKAAVGKLKDALDRETTGLGDRRRVLAEQFTQLAQARAQWQETERRTVLEMEELARGLRRREQDLDARDERLVKAEARRREEAHDLWQMRLRLEAWQSKLTAVERQWHAARERRDAEYGRRAAAMTRREAGVVELFARWERARSDERERLRAELELWADDRTRLARAAGEYDRQARAVLAEVQAHAARALAAEELLAAAGVDAGSRRAARRLAVLRTRWERTFQQKLDALDDRRAAAAADLARVEERYRELHRFLADVVEREGALNTRATRADAETLARRTPDAPQEAAPPARADGEAAVLRAEFERMAAVLIEAGVPEQPDSQLPWAAEDADAEPATVLAFEYPHNRAA